MALADTARLIAELTLEDKFSPQARKVVANLGLMESGFRNIRSHAREGLGHAYTNLKRVGLIAGTVAAGGLVGAARAAIDFEDAFAGIRKTVDEAELEAVGLTFEDLSDGIRKMAREVPIAATELAAIGETAGALGIRAQDIEEFTRVIAELGVTTDLTTDQAATSMGQLGNILDLTGEGYRELADTLVALGNAGASTESQIVDMAARFAAAGKMAGLTNDDILALASAVASMGIEVEAGGSSLSRIFTQVATNIGTNSKKAEAFASALGLSASEFKERWREDALGTLQEFLGVLGTLDQFEQAALLKKIGITGVRDIRTVGLMAQNIEVVNDALETSRTATGALGTEAAEKFKTTASQIEILKNNLTDVGITIGNELLPIITDLTTEFVEFLNTPKTQADLKKWAQDIAAGVREMVDYLRKVDWQSIGNSLKTAAEFASGLLKAFLDMPEWVKTAVITGWGLNKLTGGALGGIVSELGKGLIKGVLGMNAAVVNLNAATVNGLPGGGAPAAGGRSLLPLAGAGLAAGGIVVAVNELDKHVASGQQEQLNEIIRLNELQRLLPQKQAQEFGTVLDLTLNPLTSGLLRGAFPQLTSQLEQVREVLRDQSGDVTAAVNRQGEVYISASDANAAQISASVQAASAAEQGKFATLTAMANRHTEQTIAALDRNGNGVVSMKEVMAAKLGVSIEELRGIKNHEQTAAQRLGYSVEQLREIKSSSATAADRLNTANSRLQSAKEAQQEFGAILRRKEFDPTIKVNTTVRNSFNVSGRTIAREVSRYASWSYNRD